MKPALALCVLAFVACRTPAEKKVPVKNKQSETRQKKTTPRNNKPIHTFQKPPQIEDLCEDLGTCDQNKPSSANKDLLDEENQWYDDFYKDLPRRR